jgi:predicted CoA-binding protein
MQFVKWGETHEETDAAVVGMSNTEGKPSNFVPKYLIGIRYVISFSVNPTTIESM